ncbi:hypothetical protein SAMN06265365_11461 [Tistlia consotensis]|uniref:Uncharacterized protein n=1 Tax=Tistlia consotensis USBA 355 TaxID=560819 RepID=A0A1Y6B9F5_9PROT|nr:hypothetical protein [Tistlia consotensis]SME99921.1 hypothetical protein SAMN05428998_102302 [Tistlia consotensis USBA 355]SNR76541.1 hypothetical protein SAMN06265365_11461 [Tistlia consotensis]
MQVNPYASSLYSSLLGGSAGGLGTSSSALASTGSAASASSTATSDPAASSSSTVETLDFTDMTSQQLLDWMNNQLKSGQMSPADSGAFLDMTMNLSTATGGQVGTASDTTSYNFTKMAMQGIEGAKARHDDKAVAFLEKALSTMQSAQGSVSGLNITV